MLEALSVLWRDFSAVHISGELFDVRIGLIDVRAQLGSWREFGIAEPVMPNHSPFVRVRDRARFQLSHGRKSFFDARLHCCEKIVRKFHAADVDGKIEIVVAKKVFLKSRPERRGSHSVYLTERPSRLE